MGTVFVLRDMVDECVTATDESFGGTKQFSLAELMEAWAEGKLQFAFRARERNRPSPAGTDLGTIPTIPDLSMVDPARREEVRRRHTMVRALLSLPKRNRKSVQELIAKVAADWEKVPSRATVYRWERAFRLSGFDGRSLVSWTSKRGGKGGSRIAPEVQELIGNAITRLYLVEGTPACPQEVADYAENLIKEAGLPVPSKEAMYMRVLRTIKRLAPYDVAVAQLGQKKADAMFKANGPVRQVKRILEIVEIDHTPLDILVLPDVPTYLELPEEALYKLATRPYLTACRDRKTGLVVGWYVGFEKPGWFSVMKCIRHAIMYKSPAFLQRECPDLRHDYPVHGIPEVILCDNGPEFHSTHMEDAAIQLDYAIEYCPPGTPWVKPLIERGFRTLNQYFASMPGATFANIIKRAGYDSVKNACIAFSLLKQVLYKIVVDIEAQRYSGRLLSTRIAAWKADKLRPRIPNTTLDLVVLLGQVFERKVSVKGIEYEDITYCNDELATMRGILPEDQWVVKCKVDPSDMGRIWVLDPRSNCFMEVPAVHQEYAAGLSLWSHQVIKRFARKHMGAKSHEDLVQAKAELRRMVEERAIKRPKKRAESPQKVARFLSGDAPSAPPHDAPMLSAPAEDVSANEVEGEPAMEQVPTVEPTGEADENGSAKPQKSSRAKKRVDAQSKAIDLEAPLPEEFDDEFGDFEVDVG